MKAIIILFFFCMIAAAMKPNGKLIGFPPSVNELTKTINATCKDVCKGN